MEVIENSDGKPDKRVTDGWKKHLERWKLTGLNLFYALGCVLLIAAGFFPYVKAEGRTWTLMDGTDGIFFLIFAVLIFIFISFERKKVTGILNLVTVYFGLYELLHTFSVILSEEADVKLRAGYFVLAAGTAVLLFGGCCFIYQHGLKQLLELLYDRLHSRKKKSQT